MTPLIAVLMSVYRGDNVAHLKFSVESILRQSYKNFTLFILADGQLALDVEDYLVSVADDRLVFRKRSNNLGLAVSLNELIDLALETDDFAYVARMDADDVSDSHRFETQVGYLNNNAEIGIVGSWYNEIDTEGKVTGTVKLPTTHDQLILFMARRSPFAHPTVMARAQIFKQGFRYNSAYRFFQDYDLWVRLAAAGVRFANIPECLLGFRTGHNFYKRRASFSRALNNSMTSFRHIRNFKLYAPRYLISPLLLFILRMAPPALVRLAYQNFRKL